MKWNEMNSQQDGCSCSADLPPGQPSQEAMSCRTTSKVMWRACTVPMQCFPCRNVFLMLFSPRGSVLVSAFPVLPARSSRCSVLLQSLFVSICSPSAGSQHNTGLPVCPSTQRVPKALNFSSLKVEWVGFADRDTQGLCTPSPSHSWAVFLWWCSHGATALPCHDRISKLCSVLIHNLPLITPSFITEYKPSSWQH